MKSAMIVAVDVNSDCSTLLVGKACLESKTDVTEIQQPSKIVQAFVKIRLSKQGQFRLLLFLG